MIDYDVLIVDDDDDLRQALFEALADESFCVAAAHDGAEALSWLRAGNVPSIVLLDNTMPGVDGLAFRRAQLADARLANIPVVLMTAARPQSVPAELRCEPMLQKPVQLDHLINLVRTYMERRGAS